MNTCYRKLYIGYSCCPGTEFYWSNVAESLIFRGRNNPESNGLMIWHCGVCQAIRSELSVFCLDKRQAYFRVTRQHVYGIQELRKRKKILRWPGRRVALFLKGFHSSSCCLLGWTSRRRNSRSDYCCA